MCCYSPVFFYLQNEYNKEQLLAELETNSLQIDLLSEQQLKQLFQQPVESDEQRGRILIPQNFVKAESNGIGSQQINEKTAVIENITEEIQPLKQDTEEPEESEEQDEPTTEELEPEPEEELEPELDEELELEEEPVIEEQEEPIPEEANIIEEEEETILEDDEPAIEEVPVEDEEMYQQEDLIDTVTVERVPEIVENLTEINDAPPQEITELPLIDKPAERRKQEENMQKIRVHVKRDMDALIKTWGFDLKKQRKKNTKQRKKNRAEIISSKGYFGVKSIISANKKLFSRTMLGGKWKSPPLSAAMRRKYLPLVDEKIKLHWHIPLELDPSLEVLMMVKIAKSGKILFYEPVETSGSRVFDQSVRNLFTSLVQLPPLPESFPGDFTEIGLRFKSSQTDFYK